MLLRYTELFGDMAQYYGNSTGTVYSSVTHTFRQQRDWTCGIACMRCLLAGKVAQLPTEDEIIERASLKPGPRNSLQLGDVYDKLGLGISYKNGNEPQRGHIAPWITDLMRSHDIAIECAINGAHWITLMAYIGRGHVAEDTVVYYDPYFDEVRLIRAEELFSMWMATEKGLLDRDYFAIQRW